MRLLSIPLSLKLFKTIEGDTSRGQTAIKINAQLSLLRCGYTSDQMETSLRPGANSFGFKFKSLQKSVKAPLEASYRHLLNTSLLPIPQQG
jgi:hypothetical protein